MYWAWQLVCLSACFSFVQVRFWFHACIWYIKTDEYGYKVDRYPPPVFFTFRKKGLFQTCTSRHNFFFVPPGPDNKTPSSAVKHTVFYLPLQCVSIDPSYTLYTFILPLFHLFSLTTYIFLFKWHRLIFSGLFAWFPDNYSPFWFLMVLRKGLNVPHFRQTSPPPPRPLPKNIFSSLSGRINFYFREPFPPLFAVFSLPKVFSTSG